MTVWVLYTGSVVEAPYHGRNSMYGSRTPQEEIADFSQLHLRTFAKLPKGLLLGSTSEILHHLSTVPASTISLWEYLGSKEMEFQARFLRLFLIYCSPVQISEDLGSYMFGQYPTRVWDHR